MRGQLALAQLDLRTDLATWLDAVYAIWASAPFDLLDKLGNQVVVKAAQIDPEAARATWGQLPEHQALAGGLGKGSGLEGGANAATRPPPVVPQDPQSAATVQRWRQLRGASGS